jgi:hypothetical protein
MLANEIEEIVINARSLAAHRASGGNYRETRFFMALALNWQRT